MLPSSIFLFHAVLHYNPSSSLLDKGLCFQRTKHYNQNRSCSFYAKLKLNIYGLTTWTLQNYEETDGKVTFLY